MYPTISMKQLELWITAKKPMLLVDLRSREAYDRAHLEGAVSLPFEELEDKYLQLQGYDRIVFYCSRGSKSLLACNFLWKLGYPVVNAGGGLNAYRGRHMRYNVMTEGTATEDEFM